MKYMYITPNTSLKEIKRFFPYKNGIILNETYHHRLGHKLKNYLKLPYLGVFAKEYKQVNTAFYMMLGDYQKYLTKEKIAKCIDIMTNQMSDFFQYKYLDESLWKYFDGEIVDDDIGIEYLFSCINGKNILLIMDEMDMDIVKQLKFTYEVKDIKIILNRCYKSIHICNNKNSHFCLKDIKIIYKPFKTIEKINSN